MRCGLTSADSGLQLDLEIALNGVSAKIQPPPAFQPGRKCAETSDDVIEDDFTSTPGTRILDLSPMRLGAAKTTRESAKAPDDPNLTHFPNRSEKENTGNDGPRLSIRKALPDGAWHCPKVLHEAHSRHGKIALRSAQTDHR